MLSGIHGTLLTASFLETELAIAFKGQLGEDSRDGAYRQLRSWWVADGRWLGPASSLRTLADRGAARITRLLGYRCAASTAAAGVVPVLLGELDAGGPEAVGLLVTSWGDDLGHVWRDAVRHGIRINAWWCLAFNGQAIRVVDVRRTYARRFLEFDLKTAARDPVSFGLLWALGRADAVLSRSPDEGGGRSVLEEAIGASARHQSAVCGSLQAGVERAMAALLQGVVDASRPARGRPIPAAAMFEQTLTMIYRLLFLLFAEARGAVPLWHPIYRDSYSLEALRERLDSARPPRGLWETLQAISRLAHEGCNAGDLTATGFNGRLFSPARAPLLERLALGDAVAQEAFLALTTRSVRRAGRQRISYADLGIEQLGAVYERVLDYEPQRSGPNGAARIHLRRTGGRRKATGTFYTPRSLTDYLVRRTLSPLVEGATPDAILRLRVVDPAMGSGAFLVAACRYLARAYEAALGRDEGLRPANLDERARAGFRRLIAQRCLFGVDRNPMAVQLARLSLWLATLAADQPLTFLDHNLRVGDSVIGASLDDVVRQAPGGRPGMRSPVPLPLFQEQVVEPAIRASVVPRARIAQEPADTLAAVREKERALAAIDAPGAPLARWKAVCDAWCAWWFWHDQDVPSPRLFGALSDALLGRDGRMPAHLTRRWLAKVHAVADGRRFFHWTLEFPEVFFDQEGRPLPRPGFDAVLGNPPWEMVRADQGDASQREASRVPVRELLRFARGSGVYHATGDAHLNLYQLFLERALFLARHGGRIGLVLPAGLATDHGSAALRRLLFERCDTDAIVGLDNRRAIFPIHRSMRFLLVTATRGPATTKLACRFGVEHPEALDTIADRPDGSAFPVVITPGFLRRVSGDALAVPCLRTPADFAILDKVTATAPRLNDPAGWGACFGRELNATDDCASLVERQSGLPVIGGREVEPFVVRLDACKRAIPERLAAERLDRAISFGRPRLAYRDVSAATNRLTLIAAIVPAGAVTLHTLFCLKTLLELDEQLVLCGILNSYVANYLVRQRITSHLSVAVVEQLPGPRPASVSRTFAELAALTRALSAGPPDRSDRLARLNALVAHLYGLSFEEFDHVLSTFPLIAEDEKQRARTAFMEV